MSTVTITQELAQALSVSDERPVRLVDSQGKLVGYFSPVAVPEYAPGDGPPPLTAEELERITSEEPWYTTAEVLAHLKSL